MIVTLCADVYVPAAGLKVGTSGGGLIVYFAKLTELDDSRAAFLVSGMPFGLSAITAMAFSVSVAATAIGPEYIDEFVVGFVPSVV